MKRPRITLEQINGDRDTFTLPSKWAGWIADAICDTGRVEVEIEVEDNGEPKRYRLEHRDHCNPLWRLLDAPAHVPTDHTRHSAMVG